MKNGLKKKRRLQIKINVQRRYTSSAKKGSTKKQHTSKEKDTLKPYTVAVKEREEGTRVCGMGGGGAHIYNLQSL